MGRPVTDAEGADSRSLAGPPRTPPAVPEPVALVAAGRPVRAVWENQLGGLTFAVGDPVEEYVKWAPGGSGLDLEAEAERLAWAGAYVSVPVVVALGASDAGTWLVTTPILGESAVSDRWKADPATAVAAIGRGLRTLHDDAPVDACPFSWSADGRAARAREPVADPPPVDRLVVCHGDACAPNTLLTDDGAWSGIVDLGALGVADRWADLAVATWSTEWNYGPGWEDALLDAYGIVPDPTRTAYYRHLWDVT